MSTNYATQFNVVIEKATSLEEAARAAQAAFELFKKEQQAALHEQVMENIVLFFRQCVGVSISESDVELSCSTSHVQFWVNHSEVDEYTPRVYSRGTWEIPSFEGSLERFQETIGRCLQEEWERHQDYI